MEIHGEILHLPFTSENKSEALLLCTGKIVLSKNHVVRYIPLQEIMDDRITVPSFYSVRWLTPSEHVYYKKFNALLTLQSDLGEREFLFHHNSWWDLVKLKAITGEGAYGWIYKWSNLKWIIGSIITILLWILSRLLSA